MSIRDYVVSKFITGTNASNVELSVKQLSSDNGFAITDYKGFIAENIYYSLENFLNPNVTIATIRMMLDVDGKHLLPVYDIGSNLVAKKIVLTVKNQERLYFYDIKGNFVSRQAYEVQSIDDDDLGYMVTEHILNPDPGVTLIERCYSPIFDDLDSAVRYQKIRNKKYTIAKGSSNSGYRLFVVDKSIMLQTEWYKLNLRAANMINMYELDVEDYRYEPDIHSVIAAIEADSYDNLDVEDQASVNGQIYQAIRKYIPEFYLWQLDDDIEGAGPEDVEEIADQAIILCLVNAKSEEDFYAIHKALGPNEYRIGALTDDIYNANPDKGYILVSKDGDLGWYPDIKFIQEYKDGKDNPYYDKFQPNENDVLYCLREYHPEKVVSRLPTRKDMEHYKDLYYDDIASKRKKHPEFKIRYSEDYEEDVAFGDWYPDGVRAEKVIEGIEFPITYFNYEFNEEQCKKLLNGEEIVIEDYVSKMGIPTKIRGKLTDQTDIYDDFTMIEFTRTDIGSESRKKLNSQLGITEKGVS